MRLDSLPMCSSILAEAIDNSIPIVSSDTPLIEIINLLGQVGENLVVAGLPKNTNDNFITYTDCIVVMDSANVISIFTEKDAVRLTTAQINLAGVKIAEVIAKPVITLRYSEAENIFTTLSLMRQHSLSHLPIVDDRGQLLGIITPESLAIALETELKQTKEHLQCEIAQRASLEVALQQAQNELLAVKGAVKVLQRENSDRTATEAQLLQTTSELQEIFQAFPDLYFRLASDGTILSYHPGQIYKLYLSPKEFLGKRMQDVLPANIGYQFHQAILQIQKTNSLVAIEYSLATATEEKSFEARLLRSLHEQIIVIVRDITVRKQAEAALQTAKEELEIRVEERTTELRNTNERLRQEIVERQRIEEALRISEERYARAISAGKVGVWELNLKTNEIYIDPNLKAILGYTEDAAFYHLDDWLQFVHPDDKEQIKVKAQAYLQELTPQFELEHRMLHKDGSIRWFLARGTVLRDANGNPCCMAGSDTDITERKQAENQLKASLKEKEVLLKEIHHRVKNNLQLISSLLRLQAGYIKDQQVLDIFQDSQNRVRAMALIHENLYQSNDLAKINFCEYIRKLTNNLLRSYRVNERNISLNLNIDNVLMKIDTAIPCGLIINELVSNSIKHAFVDAQSGEIYVEFHLLNQGKYSLFVSDNGIGAPEDLEQRRTHSLGLRLVWSLVEQLEGSIAFNTKDGTAFSITFAD